MGLRIPAIHGAIHLLYMCLPSITCIFFLHRACKSGRTHGTVSVKCSHSQQSQQYKTARKSPIIPHVMNHTWIYTRTPHPENCKLTAPQKKQPVIKKTFCQFYPWDVSIYFSLVECRVICCIWYDVVEIEVLQHVQSYGFCPRDSGPMPMVLHYAYR